MTTTTSPPTTTYLAPASSEASSDEFVNVTLWAAQAVVAFAFCMFGLFKLTAPFAEVSAEFKWPGEFPPLFVRSLGLVDIVGGIGILLPALTRIWPRLTVLAAACATLLQVLAISFHSVRGEFSVLPLNFALLPLAAYVFWGRGWKVVIPALDGPAAKRRFITIMLWVAQVAVAAVFCGAGLFKLTAPIAEVAASLPFAGDFPPLFVRFVGLVDLAGGIGILLPALTRILPRFTVLAAIGCIAVQVLAMGLHTSRHEYSVLPLNATLVTLSAWVLWGRMRLAMIVPLEGQAARRRFFTVTLWLAQAVVAAIFIGAGMFKMSAPIPDLAAAMKWPGEFPAPFVRLLGAIDVAGGLGILLPALTRIQPRLTVLAALGCAVLQVLAIGFHSSRGEWSVLPLNFVLLPLAVYVLWGRLRVARIEPRD